MKKYLSCIAILLVFSPFVWSLEIPKKARVPNRSPGYCCWAGLETLGRVHRIKALYDLVEERTKDSDEIILRPWGWELLPRNLGYEHAIKNKLDGLGIRYKMQTYPNSDRGLLQYTEKDGCLVTMHLGAFKDVPGAHGVVLSHYDDKKVEFYDPNDTDYLYVGTREWFDYYWTGQIVVIFHEQK